jgi:hypothetical protein
VDLGTKWVSPALGYSFQYGAPFAVTSDDDRTAILTSPAFDAAGDGNHETVELSVSGSPASTASLAALVDARRDQLAGFVLGLTADSTSPTQLVAPSLGFIPGAGTAFKGTIDTPSGPTRTADVAIIAVRSGSVDIVMSLLISGAGLDDRDIRAARSTASMIVDTMRWP